MLAMACTDYVDPASQVRPPTTLSASTLTTLAGEVGGLASLPVEVLVADAAGRPAKGAVVRFAPAAGSGSVTPDSVRTGPDGIARGQWRFGAGVGLQAVEARVLGLATTVRFTATVTASSPASVQAVQTARQTAVVGTDVATPPAVVVRDRFGNPVAGTSVVFTITAGGGTLASATAISNASGIAQVAHWRLGQAPGENRVTALVSAADVTGNPVVFSASAVTGAPATMVARTPLTGAGVVATPVTPAPTLQVLDRFGNPVPGVTMSFTPSAGSTVGGATVATDVDGVVTVGGWLLGQRAGRYTLTVTAAGIPSLEFGVDARPQLPERLSTVQGQQQRGVAGQVAPVVPVVLVTDKFLNPVEGVAVAFEVAPGGGSVGLGRTLTSASGEASAGRWLLGTGVGLHALRATLPDMPLVSAVLFEATTVAGPPAALRLETDATIAGAAGSTVSPPPRVRLLDAYGNPVIGRTVRFSASAGTLTGATVATDGEGVAQLGGWVLPTAIGQATLTIAADSVPSLTVRAEVRGAAAARLVRVAGDSQQVVAGRAVPVVPAVRVLDAFGNPVAGAAVLFTVTEGAGVVFGGSTVANAEGLATVSGWTVGEQLGRNRLEATLVGQPNTATVQFTAIAVAGTPALLRPIDGINQTGAVATLLPVAPSVRVEDRLGNPVRGVLVKFTTGHGTIAQDTVTTDSLGVATAGRWTLGTSLGVQTLSVSVPPFPGVPPALFTATATPSAPTP